jgi:hypothetical protein
MAKSNYYVPSNEPIRLVPGVKYQRWSGTRDVYIGEADALVQSQVVQHHMFPALGHCAIAWRAQGAKQPGQSAHWEPGFTTIRRMPTGTAWRVEVVVSELEQQARAAATERKRAQDPDVQKRASNAVKAVKNSLADLPSNHQEFRDKFAERLYMFVVAGRPAVAECLAGSGYSLDQDTWTAFLESFSEALGAITEGASTFDAAKRAAYVAKLRASIAAQDEQFKPFMESLLKPIKLSEDEADHG